MPIPIPRTLVELILLGPTDDRRQLQDSPILGDVWIAFAENPAEALDLLITPHKTQPAGHVAAKIANSIDRDDTDIAYLQAILAARLDFENGGTKSGLERCWKSMDVTRMIGRAVLRFLAPGRSKRPLQKFLRPRERGNRRRIESQSRTQVPSIDT